MWYYFKVSALYSHSYCGKLCINLSYSVRNSIKNGITSISSSLTVYVLSKNVHIYGRHIYHRYAKIYKISSLCPWLVLGSAIGIYRSCYRHSGYRPGGKEEEQLDVDWRSFAGNVLSLHCRRTAAVDVLYSRWAGNSAHNSSSIIVQRERRGKELTLWF